MNDAANTRTTVATSNDKCTIYYRGGMGNVIAIEVKSCDVKTGKWAQYNSALFLTFRKPRQRKDRGAVLTDSPSLLIVEGHSAPAPDSMFHAAEESDSGALVSTGRYAGFDPRWQGDFDTMINAHIADGAVKVVFDGRGHNTHGGF